MRAEEFVTERKKKKRKNRYFGGYWYPGYGYYGGGYYGSGDGNSGDGGGGESIQEKIDDAITKHNFYADKVIELPEVGKLKLVAHSLRKDNPPQFRVDVINEQGEKIGYFRFIVMGHDPETRFKLFAKKTDPYVIGGNVSVWNEYQRKGIARAVYDWIRSMGNDIRPSTTQTDAGRAMWRSFERQPTNEVAIDAQDLVDVYIRGQYKGETVTRLVARAFPNNKIPLLIRKLETKHGVNPNAVVYGPSQIQNENFADGKVKGKSRPGRVKRAGASCKGSVTDLRARAKRYGGERGRMYHWCANMKGGRKNESADYLTELNVGNYRMGNTIFKITQHAIDRLQERKVPFPTVNELLRRVSTIRNQIEQLGVGQKLWAYDPSLEISLGLRLLDSGRINVGTAILGSPKHQDSSVPIITLD